MWWVNGELPHVSIKNHPNVWSTINYEIQHLPNISTLARHGGWKNNDFLKHGLGDIPTKTATWRWKNFHGRTMQQVLGQKAAKKRDLHVMWGLCSLHNSSFDFFAICQTISNYIKLIRYIFHFSSTLKFSKWDIFILSTETSFPKS